MKQYAINIHRRQSNVQCIPYIDYVYMYIRTDMPLHRLCIRPHDSGHVKCQKQKFLGPDHMEASWPGSRN